MAAEPPLRTFQDDSGPYVLPNDSQEHTRLDSQSKAFFNIMGRTFHAPLQSPKRILDVGCGTGILTVELARKYPEAEVIGVDIAPVPVHLHGELPNLKYVQGDIAALAGQNGGDFESRSFDYVFARLLMCAITDWPSHVKRVVDLVAPGGWVELQDFNFEIHTGPNNPDYAEGTNMTATWEWHHHFVRDCAASGLDMTCGKSLAGWMEAAGAVNIKEQLYRMPPGGPPNADESDKAYFERGRKTQEGLIDKICSRQNPPEVVARLKQDMWSTFGKVAQGDWAAMHVVIGQGSGSGS